MAAWLPTNAQSSEWICCTVSQHEAICITAPLGVRKRSRVRTMRASGRGHLLAQLGASRHSRRPRRRAWRWVLWHRLRASLGDLAGPRRSLRPTVLLRKCAAVAPTEAESSWLAGAQVCGLGQASKRGSGLTVTRLRKELSVSCFTLSVSSSVSPPFAAMRASVRLSCLYFCIRQRSAPLSATIPRMSFGWSDDSSHAMCPGFARIEFGRESDTPRNSISPCPATP